MREKLSLDDTSYKEYTETLCNYYESLYKIRSTGFGYSMIKELSPDEIDTLIIKRLIWASKKDPQRLVNCLKGLELIDPILFKKVEDKLGENKISGLLGANEWGLL